MEALCFPPCGSYAYEPHPESGDPVASRKTRIAGAASSDMHYGGGEWNVEENKEYYQGQVRKTATAGHTVQFSFRGADIY